MERAGGMLLAMDYLGCEALCMQALGLARAAGDFDRYSRILLPLQESRRQRRQAAVDAGIHVISGARMEPAQILDPNPTGCLMLTSPPYTPVDEQALRQLARQRGLMVEVLLMDGEALRACFERQMEHIGEAALAAMKKNLSPVAELEELEKVLDQVGDHEVAHQRLAAAARNLAQNPA